MAAIRAQEGAAQRNLLAAEHGMRALLGLKPDVAVPLAPLAAPPIPDRAAVTAAAARLPQVRPDLRALQHGYRSQEAQVRIAVLSQFPNVVVGFTRARDFSNVHSIGGAVSLTLPLFDRGRGQIAIQRATRAQLRAEYQARLDQASSDIWQLWSELQELRGELGGLDRRLPPLQAERRQCAARLRGRQLPGGELPRARQRLPRRAVQPLRCAAIALDRFHRACGPHGDANRTCLHLPTGSQTTMTRLAWIFIAVAGVCSTYAPARADEGAAPVSVLVQTTAVKKGSLPRIVIAYGAAQAAPSARDSLMAPVAAVVADVYVRTGQSVAKGAPLVALAPTPQTGAAYAAAASAAKLSSDALVRTRQLRAESLATELQLAAAEKADTDARAALAALRAQGAAGTTVLRAPAAAVVTAVGANQRAIVAEGTPLVDLARPGGLVLLAGVVPAEAATIKPGDQVAVTPIGSQASYPAKVLLRGAAVDPGNGLVPIEVSLPAGALLPGESAQAAITTGHVTGFVVPHVAVLVNDQGGTYVVQAIAGAAKLVPVRVLLPGGASDVVDGALDAAAPLVLAGAYQLQDGMKVRFR